MDQDQYEQIRSLDQSRSLTSATCQHFTNLCVDLPDLICFNIYTDCMSIGQLKSVTTRK